MAFPIPQPTARSSRRRADTVLDSFTIYIRGLSGSTLRFRAELYAWDGAKATGPALWESTPRTLTLSDDFQPVTFTTGGVPLTAGQQYVFFGSVSKDYQQSANSTGWGFVGFTIDAYSGGALFFEQR